MYQILILSSGTMSYRNTSEGSWYIQEICQVFFKNAAKMDVLHMLTQVNEHLLETVFMSAPLNFGKRGWHIVLLLWVSASTSYYPQNIPSCSKTEI